MSKTIQSQYLSIKNSLDSNITLVAVSKTHTVGAIQEIYNLGQRDFGENKVQELCEKQQQLPNDIQWHLIGHLQTNKVKFIVPFVYLIHSVDSVDLLIKINVEAEKINRKISVLLQVKIATEETKFGLSKQECLFILQENLQGKFPFIEIKGLMGMASFTNDKKLIANEFQVLESLYKSIKNENNLPILSMGMSDDFLIAIENGSNMIRVGSKIFGNRNYDL